MNYQQLAHDVHKAQNQVRTNPQSFIPKLEAMLPLFQGDVYRKPGKIALRTNEGPSAVKECIDYLRNAKPVPELTLTDGMCNACKDHANDIGPKGQVSHSGSDGSSFSKRLERYGDWMGTVGENCEFGGETGEEVVINLMVDDGVMNRGHRKNMFSPDFKFVGIACSQHGAYDHCTVLDYAAQYGPKGSKGNSGFGGFSSNPTTNYSSNPTTSYSSGPTSNYSSGPTSNYNSNYQPLNSFGGSTPSNNSYGNNQNVNYAPPSYGQPTQGVSYNTGSYGAPNNQNINYAPPSNQSYNQAPPSNQSYNQAPPNQSYNQAPPSNQPYGQAPSNNTYTSYTTNQIPGGQEKVQTTFTTKSFGDHDLFNDPRIAEQLSKMRLQSDFSSGSLRDTASKDAPPGAVGWSTTSNTTITNGQKVSKITTVYKMADGSTQEITKEVVEKSC